MNRSDDIIIYKTENGDIDVKLEQETVWLTQKQMAILFDKDISGIARHIKNIFKEGELAENSVIANFANSEKTAIYPIIKPETYYNLDMIISVGYRVNSKQGIEFRKWATSKLKEYLINGYSLNTKLLKEKSEKLKQLRNTFNLLNRSITNSIDNIDDAQKIMKILNDFSTGFNLLDDYDNNKLDSKGKTKNDAIVITKEEFLSVIEKMKTKFSSPLFGNLKDNSFESSINQIYQSFDGNDLYPTIEEKAVNLLYMIVKNHSFSDGNKRIAANCFLYFLDKNGLLYKNQQSLIDAPSLAVITLLIAESKPSEDKTVKQIVLSILNRA